MSNYSEFRGKCKEISEAACIADPSLTLVRGFYHDLQWGKQQHWWCKTPEGQIVDLTKDQFPSKGSGDYEEFDGRLACEECGKEIHENDQNVIWVGRYPCCSSRCALRLVGL